MLQEESSNLKAKMIQLTEENNKLKKDKAKLTHSAAAEHRELIERQKEEIRTLKGQLYQESSEKGLKLLAALQGVASLVVLQLPAEAAELVKSHGGGGQAIRVIDGRSG